MHSRLISVDCHNLLPILQAWADRILGTLLPSVTGGPLFFLRATDWEDAPLVNMRALVTELGHGNRGVCYDWRSHVQGQQGVKQGSISSMLRKRPLSDNSDPGMSSLQAVNRWEVC